jgi:hypothetical protein
MIDFRRAACQSGRQRARNGSNHATRRCAAHTFRIPRPPPEDGVRATHRELLTAMTGWKLPAFRVFFSR